MRDALLCSAGMLAIFTFMMTIGFHWRHGAWVWEVLS